MASSWSAFLVAAQTPDGRLELIQEVRNYDEIGCGSEIEYSAVIESAEWLASFLTEKPGSVEERFPALDVEHLLTKLTTLAPRLALETRRLLARRNDD
jgi:hypothetical protein